ncbi:MAG: hypothetical protein ACRC33_14395 [Gemmataceae bacterium]
MYEVPLTPGEIVIAGGELGFEDEDFDEVIRLVGITHQVDDIPSDDRLGLPYLNGRRHPVTGLEGESAAHCGWYVEAVRQEIAGRIGHVTDLELAFILRRLKARGILF